MEQMEEFINIVAILLCLTKRSKSVFKNRYSFIFVFLYCKIILSSKLNKENCLYVDVPPWVSVSRLLST